MQIKTVELSELNPSEYNPRQDLQPGDAEYEKIKRSIQGFGYVDPIIINSDGTIIGGHQRYKILLELGYKKVEVSVVDLDKAQEKALNIALNKTGGGLGRRKTQGINW
jgi:ParB-like chromosome segregation protein Spo0J